MDYLYQAMKRETNLEQPELESESPDAQPVDVAREAPLAAAAGPIEPMQDAPSRVATDGSAVACLTPTSLSGVARSGSGGTTRDEEFYPDVVAASAAVQQHPELFYALSSDSMTKDRVVGLEQIRVLRSRIMEFMRMRGMRALMITSSAENEGKTVTSINLSLALSHVQGLRILLVDTDLRRPAAADVLGVSSEGGLLPYLKSEAPLSPQRLNDRLWFLPAERTHNSVELLHSAKMEEFVRTARENYNLVIFDAPPLYSIADAQILANYVDAVLLCVRGGRTRTDLVAECAGMVSEKLIGTVLVGGERQTDGYQAYSYTYSHGSGGDAQKD